MDIWTLIIIFSSISGVAIEHVEFYSKEKCEIAASTIGDSMNTKTFCVDK